MQNLFLHNPGWLPDVGNIDHVNLKADPQSFSFKYVKPAMFSKESLERQKLPCSEKYLCIPNSQTGETVYKIDFISYTYLRKIKLVKLTDLG